jgi:hypothetical protein
MQRLKKEIKEKLMYNKIVQTYVLMKGFYPNLQKKKEKKKAFILYIIKILSLQKHRTRKKSWK